MGTDVETTWERQMYFNRKGEPIDAEGYIEVFRQPFEESRRVAKDSLKGYEVSTVFLSLNHSFDPSGPPLIFETMIFSNKHPEYDNWQWRYSTEEQALAGHRAIVRCLEEGIEPQPFVEGEAVDDK